MNASRSFHKNVKCSVGDSMKGIAWTNNSNREKKIERDKKKPTKLMRDEKEWWQTNIAVAIWNAVNPFNILQNDDQMMNVPCF